MKEPYPFTHDTTYELQADGLVKVVRSGREGLFRWDGTPVSGELRTADPQMCIWVAGWEAWRAGPEAAARTKLVSRPARPAS